MNTEKTTAKSARRSTRVLAGSKKKANLAKTGAARIGARWQRLIEAVMSSSIADTDKRSIVRLVKQQTANA